MYKIIEDVIKNGDYELLDILNKINKLWLENSLAEEERNTLIELARTYAIPENSYPENAQQIANLWEYCQELDARLAILENAGDTEPPLEEEWPEFVQPAGGHDVYKVGDKITFKEKKYICILGNCVWDPLAYPTAWELVEE